MGRGRRCSPLPLEDWIRKRATLFRSSIDVTPALHGHEMALVTAAHENSAVQGALLYNAVGLEPFMDVIWTSADQPGNIANQGKLARRK